MSSESFGFPLKGSPDLPREVAAGLARFFGNTDRIVFVYENPTQSGDYKYLPVWPDSDVGRFYEGYQLVGTVNLETGRIREFIEFHDREPEVYEEVDWHTVGRGLKLFSGVLLTIFLAVATVIATAIGVLLGGGSNRRH